LVEKFPKESKDTIKPKNPNNPKSKRQPNATKEKHSLDT
jgi:hypothetical protein